MRQAQATVADLRPELVFAGFSRGTGAAEAPAGPRRGALRCDPHDGALDPAGIGLEEWPLVPAQMHYGQGDALVDSTGVRALPHRAGITWTALSNGRLVIQHSSAWLRCGRRFRPALRAPLIG
jgi:hypothetical protein